MFDDFTYSSKDDPALSTFNKWNIVNGTSGPPEGAQYSRNNVNFVNDPNNQNNRLMTLSTTVNGTTKATTHSRIETGGYEYFEGTYAARVYFSENPFQYKDGNVQTFYTIVSSALSGDGSRYSELDFEYLAADKWGISPDNQVMYMTSWNRYIANPWQAWKRYFASQKSWQGWHTCVVTCTDGVNVKYWIDGQYFGSMSVTDNDGTSVYPRSNMHIAFANWIWNNVTGSSTANRTTTMEVDWVLHYKNQEISPQQVDALVANYRSQGLQRRNLLGQTYYTSVCTVPAQPAAISGNTTVAPGSTQTYSVTAVSGATSYTWTLPSGWSGTSSSNTITTTAGSTGGTITVRANNTCGSSAARSLNVTVQTTSSNLATNKPVMVSSIEGAGLEGNKAVDGSLSTRWASAYSNAQWMYVDLGANYSINRVKVLWEAAYGRDYQIQVSTNATSWQTIKTISGNTALTNDHTGLNGTGRYVRINGTARGTSWGYSIFELEVYGTPATTGGFTSRIEAENYTSMFGIQTENCSEGGLNVGYFDASDWMSYNVNIPAAGTYQVSYRVASINSGKTLRLERINGSEVILLGTVTVPNTGSWQGWATVSHTVTLPAGQYPLGITTYTGGLNLNWFEITNNLSAARMASADTEASLDGSNGHELSVYPNPVLNTLNIQQWSDAFKGGQIKIMNSAGKEFFNAKVRGESVDLSSLPAGLYIFHISKGQDSIVKKFIKQ